MNTTTSQPPAVLLGTDLLGSPVAKKANDERSRINYTPFGHINHLAAKVIGFTGNPKEWPNGQYLLGNGYRGYAPSLMRLIASDTYSPFGAGGRNSYAYCEADPVNASDQSGHSFIRISALFNKLVPKTTSTMAYKGGVARRVANRSTPNGIPISANARKQAAAIAERPSYTFADVTPVTPTRPNWPLPAIPNTGPRSGRLRNPVALNNNDIRPSHLYHRHGGVTRNIRQPEVVPINNLPTPHTYKLPLDKIAPMPIIWEF